MYVSRLDLIENKDKIISLYKNEKRKIFLVKNKTVEKWTLHNNKKYIEEKKKEFKWLLDNINGYSLDDRQREIVLSEEDSTLVLAGAGSGKTLTILGRILYLVNKGISPTDILCISFTNAACQNLKRRLEKMGILMDVFTFHRLGVTILKDNGLGFKVETGKMLSKVVENYVENDKLVDILPDFEFVDVGDGDFDFLHREIILKTPEVNNLKLLLITFINLFKGNGGGLEDFDNFLEINKKEKDTFKRYKQERLLNLLRQIYESCTYLLHKNKSIDFNDMLAEAIKVVRQKGIFNYKYIIVDEFQDSSLVKCELLQEIKKVTGAKLLVVGDDFQSIYRFTGANLEVFLNFSKLFPYSKIFKLENTYRNSQELLDIMGKFILKNKKQMVKKLKSPIKNNTPIYIYYYDKSYLEVWDMVIKDIDGEVLVIGRNNRDIKNLTVKNGEVMTAHKSKGLEADNVIIVNLEDGVLGFPNKIVSDDLLKFVIDLDDSFPYEEERRLFYVAMTRTKNNNYLLVNKNKPSVFVQELLKENQNIVIRHEAHKCPMCQGKLVKRTGKYGEFYGCTNYPKCNFTQKCQ